jgi:hypothetical protein
MTLFLHRARRKEEEGGRRKECRAEIAEEAGRGLRDTCGDSTEANIWRLQAQQATQRSPS